MARLMLSAGMFSAFAAAIAVRRRGLPSGSPPPPLAAMVISLMRRVKILPRLASVAPFLCLIVAHFEWPDMYYLGDDFAWPTVSCGLVRPCDLTMLRGGWRSRPVGGGSSAGGFLLGFFLAWWVWCFAGIFADF